MAISIRGNTIRFMERHTERINGIPTRLHHLTNGELENNIGYAFERMNAAGHDLHTLQEELGRRGGQLVLGETVHTFQTPLVNEVQEAPDITPPAA